MWRWAIAFGVGMAFSCAGSSVFVCGSDEECSGGRCETNGYCSFPDDDCASGWVYGDLSAPQLAGECVDGEDGSTGTTMGPPGEAEVTTGNPLPPPDGSEEDDGTTSGGVDPGTTSTSSTTTPPDTGPPPTDDGMSCPPREEFLVWVEDSEIMAPMQTEVASSLPGAPLYAYSEEEGIGTVTFHIELQCEATVYAWGLVLDPVPGDNPSEDPDSFNISIDGSIEGLWEYGCAFEGSATNWRWAPIHPIEPCSRTPFGLGAAEGPHSLIVRNGEGQAANTTSGIAAVYISTDEGDDPNDAFPLGGP